MGYAIDLNIKHRTVKFLEDKIIGNVDNVEFNN